MIYWCGAATYARRALGQSWQAQITIARTLGPSQVTGQRSAVQYTMDPGALGITQQKNPSFNALAVGDYKSITEANGFCSRLRMPR